MERLSRLSPLPLVLLALTVPLRAASAAGAAPPAAEPPERVMNVTLVPAVPSGAATAAAKPARAPAAGAAGSASPDSAAPRSASPARGRPAPARARSGETLPAALWIAALAAATLWLAGRIARRHRRLRCEKCRARMERLARVEAFAHLDAAERTEQLVGDVLHEVWRCRGCGGITKQAHERALPEAARRLVPPVGSAADIHRRSRQGLGFLTALERSEREAGAARPDRAD